MYNLNTFFSFFNCCNIILRVLATIFKIMNATFPVIRPMALKLFGNTEAAHLVLSGGVNWEGGEGRGGALKGGLGWPIDKEKNVLYTF